MTCLLIGLILQMSILAQYVQLYVKPNNKSANQQRLAYFQTLASCHCFLFIFKECKL